VKISDAKLLLAYARLQLEIAASRLPAAQMAQELGSFPITKSVGFKKLRAFFVGLRPAKREQFRKVMRDQIQATRELMAQAKLTGELSLADITYVIRDDAGQAIEAPVFEPSTDCPASGLGIPGVIKIDGQNHVNCPTCARRWPANEIGFQIPQHEPVTA